jgi:hypothetical protein
MPLGKYLLQVMDKATAEPRFSLHNKGVAQKRTVLKSNALSCALERYCGDFATGMIHRRIVALSSNSYN